jgi:2,3-diaminopropionate biosynthesis protein SbnB
MLILGADDVRAVLDGAETAVLDAVREAYLLHAQARTTVPHSVFLRFPEDPRNRIIALPAYLGADPPLAGVKWVSSFPGNVSAGLDRAAAVVLLNSTRTGRPEALLEAATISARRTAAGAALAARTLRSGSPDTGAALIGCGVINFEVLRFLEIAIPELAEVTLFDLDRRRAAGFAERCAVSWPQLKVVVADSVEETLAAHRLVSLATTATEPHLTVEHCRPGTLVLHLSLRDLTEEAVLGCVNVVDDADHVCREGTSLYRAEQRVGNREFIASSLGELLDGGPAGRDDLAVTVFSPFGLGVLDLAVAELVRRGARRLGIGTEIENFLPGGAG